jgi:hypothetical protein
MLRTAVFVLVMTACTATAEESARQLARILASKGVLTAAELDRVEHADPTEGIQLLTAVLYQKGVLTSAEVARVSGQVASGPAPMLAVAPVPGPQAVAAPKAPDVVPEVSTASRSRLQIYGTALWNAFDNTAGVNIEDIPSLATKRGTDPYQNFGMTVRQMRFGARLQGPKVFGAAVTGVTEMDFFGATDALANGVGMDIPRLRLAYGRMDWRHAAIEVGQDWSVFSPLNPTSLAAFAIPALSTSGNPWIRTPQFRFEWHGDASQPTRLLFQAAALDPNIGDNPTTVVTSRTPGIGERGKGPAGETRLALLTKFGDQDASIGLSSHYNRGLNVGTLANQTAERAVDSWGVNLDYTLPVAKKLEFTGEAFVGRALGLFSVSSGQTVLPPGTPGEHGVAARGGWAQAQLNFNSKWQMNLDYGIESIDGSNLRTGDRSKNQTYMANLMYKMSPRITWAWEWRRFLTNYRNQAAANAIADHTNMAIAYTF